MRRALVLVLVALLLVGCGAAKKSDSARNTPSASRSRQVASPSPVPPLLATPTISKSPCGHTVIAGFVRLLNRAWNKRVAPVDPGSQVAPFIVATWVFQYTEAESALAAYGCPNPPSGFLALDASVVRLRIAAHDGGPLLYGAVQETALQLRRVSALTGVRPVGSTTCADLTKHLQVSFVLRDQGDPTGQALYPRVTVVNGSNQTVIVDFVGEGKATSDFGDSSMSWGGFTDSNLRIRAGRTASLDLGLNTGETLYVSNGQHVISAHMRAHASSADRAVSDCSIGVQGP